MGATQFAFPIARSNHRRSSVRHNRKCETNPVVSELEKKKTKVTTILSNKIKSHLARRIRACAYKQNKNNVIISV